MTDCTFSGSGCQSPLGGRLAQFCITFVLDAIPCGCCPVAKPRTRKLRHRVQRLSHLVRLCAARPCPLCRLLWRLHAPGRGRPCAASPACQLAPARPARPPPVGAPSVVAPAALCPGGRCAPSAPWSAGQGPRNANLPPLRPCPPRWGGLFRGRPCGRPAGRLRVPREGRRCAAPARAAGGSSSRRGRRRAGAARSSQRVTRPGPQGERHPSRCRRRGVRARRYRCLVLLAREPV